MITCYLDYTQTTWRYWFRV